MNYKLIYKVIGIKRTIKLLFKRKILIPLEIIKRKREDRNNNKTKCPQCDYPQYCPCDSCIDQLPKGYKPWIWLRGELVSCGNCGFTAHCDQWTDIEWEQFKKRKDNETY